jgi:hypothetical protein
MGNIHLQKLKGEKGDLLVKLGMIHNLGGINQAKGKAGLIALSLAALS